MKKIYLHYADSKHRHWTDSLTDALPHGKQTLNTTKLTADLSDGKLKTAGVLWCCRCAQHALPQVTELVSLHILLFAHQLMSVFSVF